MSLDNNNNSCLYQFCFFFAIVILCFNMLCTAYGGKFYNGFFFLIGFSLLVIAFLIKKLDQTPQPTPTSISNNWPETDFNPPISGKKTTQPTNIETPTPVSKPVTKDEPITKPYQIDEKADRAETEALLYKFRQTFTVDHNREISPRFNPPDEFSDLSEISLDYYRQPHLEEPLEDKIAELQEITQKVEQNLVAESPGGSNENNLKIDYQKELNPMQFLAASTLEGPLLVIAGAGSGKTRTVVYRVAYMLENDIPPDQILLLTFTRKAANEMLDRTEKLLNDNRSQKIMGGTFHSFSNFVLRRYSNLLGISPKFTIIDTIDAEDIIDLIKKELKFEKKSRAFPKKGRVYSIITKSRNCQIDIDQVITREQEYTGLDEFIEDIEIIAQAFDEYKRANNMFDYDDLLYVLRDSLQKNKDFRENLQKKYKYIMVDEFQDTNIVQKEIVDLLAASYKNIMVVGDDAQSIYAFRGANFENILRFVESYPNCKYVKLEQNYRSNQELLNFTNSVIENAKIGYKKRLFSNKVRPGKPIIKKFYDQEDEATYIVDRILEMREQDIPLNEIAVLYRATYHGNYIQVELTKRNIPFIVVGGIRFSERRHVKDIIAYLRILLNPYDAISWTRILKLIEGIGNVSAVKIITKIKEKGGVIDFSDYKSRKYFNALNELSEMFKSIAVETMALAQKIELIRRHYAPILENVESDFQIRLSDIEVIIKLAQKYTDLEKFLTDFSLDPPSNKFQDSNTPLINSSEERPVTLSTVHSAKGLEWYCVLIPHLLDGLFPNARALHNIEQLEEERRLFYVATSRAKEKLYLTMPSFMSSYNAYFTMPSRFLAEVKKETYDYVK